MRLLVFSLLLAAAGSSESLEQLVDANRLDEARRRLREIIASSGTSARTQLIEAMILYREGRYVPSLDILKDLLGPEQRDANVYKLFGLNLIALDRQADAEPFFRAAALLAPEDTMARYYLAMSELSLSRYDRAERLFREVIRRKPDYVPAHTMLALTLEQQDNTEAAIEAYRSAAATARVHGQPAIEPELFLARVLIARSRFAESLEVLNALTASAPNHAEAHALLGRSLSAVGRHEDALNHLRRATELDPKNRQARYALARALQRLGRTKEAEQQYRIFQRDDNSGQPAPR